MAVFDFLIEKLEETIFLNSWNFPRFECFSFKFKNFTIYIKKLQKKCLIESKGDPNVFTWIFLKPELC